MNMNIPGRLITAVVAALILFGLGSFSATHFRTLPAALAQSAPPSSLPSGGPPPGSPPPEGTPGAPGMHGGHHGHMGAILKTLGLSDQQKAKIKQIMHDTHAKNENADPQTRHANMKAAMDQIRTSVLTPQQRARFDAKVKEWKEQHPEGGPPGGPR
jgi:Spy/CpxP family protein refolding chaperone